MVKKASDKKRPTRTAAADVVSREYTINMHKRLHGVYDSTAHTTSHTPHHSCNSESRQRQTSGWQRRAAGSGEQRGPAAARLATRPSYGSRCVCILRYVSPPRLISAPRSHSFLLSCSASPPVPVVLPCSSRRTCAALLRLVTSRSAATLCGAPDQQTVQLSSWCVTAHDQVQPSHSSASRRLHSYNRIRSYAHSLVALTYYAACVRRPSMCVCVCVCIYVC